MLITYPLFMFSSGLTLQNTRIVRAEGLKHVCLFWIGLCGVWICVFSQSFLKIDYKRLYTLLKNLYIFQGLKQFQFSHEYQFIISRMSNVLILRNSCSINFDFDSDYQFGVENQDSFQFQNTSANSIGLHYYLQTIFPSLHSLFFHLPIFDVLGRVMDIVGKNGRGRKGVIGVIQS